MRTIRWNNRSKIKLNSSGNSQSSNYYYYYYHIMRKVYAKIDPSKDLKILTLGLFEKLPIPSDRGNAITQFSRNFFCHPFTSAVNYVRLKRVKPVNPITPKIVNNQPEI
ncbi:hypothetical protein BpHYR1_022283 [Brachionus plicatilis]|uniref:Uncharacterized protein n=1 Tax=Brachionus plicatilis TaxID=10195 RepID=A0A3M7PIJ0_BRAPC|nr:hypothetical protein BpHYR1_022283 [Brachionus plicatilis]